jgi:3-oxoacyl-[acyl-carrier protein] reductase
MENSAMISVKGKWALITGASRGIGYLTALFMAKQGCNLVLHSRSIKHTQKLLEEVKAFGVDVYCVEAELANLQEVDKMLDEIEAKGTAIDIVFNNAAVQLTYRKEYFKTPIQDIDLSLRVNFIAVSRICYRLIPKMIERGFGRIINLTSGIRDQPEQAGYSASKAALDKFTNDLGYKLNGTDVIISLADPGWCRTDLGGPQADHAPEDSIPGVAVPAFVNDKTSGRFFNATNFIGLSLEEAVKKGEAQKVSN